MTAVVLVRLHEGNFQFGSARDDASDLRFVAADDKTLLPFHIEKFDGLLNEAYVWIKVPDLKAGAPGTFWLLLRQRGAERIARRGCQGHLRRRHGARLPFRGKRRAAEGFHRQRQPCGNPRRSRRRLADQQRPAV
ncbi:MAG: DUF2341 domain-containing protein [Chthoniobacter sp.]